jgi:hypothetical protein
MNWLKTYWPFAILALLMLAALDATLSSLLSCLPVSATSGASADAQQAKENCTAFAGPVLTTLRWIAGATHKYEGLITAAFTVVLAIFTGRLWFSTEKLSESTKKLVEGAEDTAKRQLRAYLGLARFNIEWERHEFIIVVRNDGQTPARQVSAFFNTQWYPPGQDLPLDFSFADYNQDPDGSGPIFITPGQEHPWSFQLDWERFTRFNNGALAQFYLYGRFEYFDVFGEQRISEFCYQAVRFSSGGGAFRVASRHNDAT